MPKKYEQSEWMQGLLYAEKVHNSFSDDNLACLRNHITTCINHGEYDMPNEMINGMIDYANNKEILNQRKIGDATI